MMKVGFGQDKITPRVGTDLIGYRKKHASTAVHDPLLATAVAIEDENGTRCVFLGFDLLDMDRRQIECIAVSVCSATGVPRERLMFNCSHTHTGPHVGSPDAAPDGGAYLDFLVRQASAAAGEAVARLEPAEATALSVPVNMAVNRNVILPNGEYRYFPNFKHLRSMLDGPVDARPYALLFRKPGTAIMIGSMVNHNCHPVFLGVMSTEISADYIGYYRRAMTETTGAPAMFLQGHCGNTHPPQPESGHSAAKRYGESLAEAVLDYGYAAMAQRKKKGYDVDGAISACLCEPYFEVDPAKLDCHHAFRGGKRDAYMETRDGVLRSRVLLQALKIDQVAFCGLPGEVVAQLALHIKWNSPFRQTWMSYFATDQVGYISHRNGFVHGGYETAHHVLAPAEGRHMADAYIRMLDALASDDS